MGQLSVYRQAGLSLADAKRLLDAPSGGNASVLEDQLGLLNEEIKRLRRQQHSILRILKDEDMMDRVRFIRKDTWIAVLHSLGFDEVGLRKLHEGFERMAPDEHQAFLEDLGLPPEHIDAIRAAAGRP